MEAAAKAAAFHEQRRERSSLWWCRRLGGGKSDALVMEATRQVNIPQYKGLILRKTFPQLRELIDKSLNYYPRAFPGCKYNSTDHTWRFPSGAKIIFGSLQHSESKYNYQGQAYDFIAFDELTQFSFDDYIYLMSRNRPNCGDTRCYIRATANPGGIGHGWVKARFVTAAPAMQTIWNKVEVQQPDGSVYKDWMSRVFVPSSVFDNRALLDNDPTYLARLGSLPEAEKRALLYGDWDSFQGQYFDSFRNNPDHYKDRKWTNVIEPFDIPKHWRIYRSFDWGFARPFSCGWWAVDENDVCYRIMEYYGCKKGQPNTGVRMVADDVFAKIHEIECTHPWLKGKNILGVADPAIWDAESGESFAETAARHRVYFDKGDHKRLPGWMQCRYRMAFDKDGYPMMYVFTTCKDFIRTIPTLIHDEHNVEDLDTEGEDHIADEMRYFFMTRPMAPVSLPTPEDIYSSPLHLILDINPKDLPPARPLPRMEIRKHGEK